MDASASAIPSVLVSSQEAQTFIQLDAPVLSGEHVCDLSLGTNHSALVTESGKCITFGSNSHGQLGRVTSMSITFVDMR